MAFKTFIFLLRVQLFVYCLQDFAEHYVNCNPSTEKGAVDAILILAFAIVMLNTDLHSPNVKRRMTEMDFINNLRGKSVLKLMVEYLKNVCSYGVHYFRALFYTLLKLTIIN